MTATTHAPAAPTTDQPNPPTASGQPATPKGEERRTSLTIEQAVSVLWRSGRGRIVGQRLYCFLNDQAASLDMNGKMAVLSLIEEMFINCPGTVLDALSVFVEGGAA